MKLSNKILIGFFGFVFLYLTAVFAEVRFRGTLTVIDDANSVAETVDISGVRYLVLQDLDHHINIIGSEAPRLEVRSRSGDLLQRLNYDISGDTLSLSDLHDEDIRSLRISVFVSKRLKGVTVNAAAATIEGLAQDRLDLSQNAGRIYMSGNTIGTIHLEASAESYLDYSAHGLDTLVLSVDDSQVMVHSTVTVLKGSMKNNGFLGLNDVREIQFKTDESSALTLYR